MVNLKYMESTSDLRVKVANLNKVILESRYWSFLSVFNDVFD